MFHILESVPIVFGVCVLIASFFRYMTALSTICRVAILWISFNTFLLIVAQSSWWYSTLVLFDLKGEIWANVVWTMFNTSVMAFQMLLLIGDFSVERRQ